MIKSPSGVTVPNTDKRNRFKATVLAAAIAAVLPLAASAAGLGKITVLSAMGQPLRAELEVTATRDEAPSLVAKVAAVDAFRQAGIEYSSALATLRFSRDIKERGGRRYLEVTTDRPLNEPFIDMLVELSWASGRLVREYTFLLDPPDLAPRTAPVPVAAPEVRTEPAVAKPAAAVPAQTQPVIDSRPAASKPMAERAEKPAAKPAGGSSRTVVAGDTLGKIAAQTKPEGVSLDQMLVSLFRSNKDAFDGGNMNRLKAGKILSIPDAEAVSGVSVGEAHKEVVAQAADFNAYRKRLASAAAAEPARDQVAKQSVSGKIAPKVEDKVPVATGKDKLEVSRTEAAKDAKGKPLQGRIATLEEDLVARDRALKEASSRIADLEKNLSDLKKLAELKSQAGVDLQKQAQATKPAAAEARKPDVPAPAAAPAKLAEAPKAAEPAKPAEAPKAAEPPKPAEAAKPAEAPKPGEAAKPADAAAAAKPAEAPKPPAPKKKFVPPPPPPPEPDFIEENAPLVFGGGAVLALLFGWLGISALRKKRAAAAEANATIAETDLSAHSVFSTTTVAPPPSEQEPSQFSSTGMGMASHQETVDPVVEADTFLAFGRDAQAEEILLEALKADPQRQAVHLKLLDIYAARKNVSQFESVAKELHVLTGGTGANWEKAAAMGAALDPANSLYTAMPSEAAVPAVPEMDATTVFQAAPLAVEPPAPEIAAAAPTEAVALDFDLDIGTADSAEAAPVAEAVALDFDLDLGAPETAQAPAAAPSAEVKSEAAGLDINFDMPTMDSAAAGLDFPLAAEAPETPAVAPEAPIAVAADSSSIDFEFDLGTPVAEVAAEPLSTVSLELPELAVAPAPAATPLDLGGISLELDTPAVSASAGPDLSGTEQPDNPEVATKMELAMAYEEMGDRDGARELYQEAVAEGSPAQQQAARAKLDSLG
jgi:pilus assembly protein FimV